jgi:hypothetical protein
MLCKCVHDRNIREGIEVPDLSQVLEKNALSKH